MSLSNSCSRLLLLLLHHIRSTNFPRTLTCKLSEKNCGIERFAYNSNTAASFYVYFLHKWNKNSPAPIYVCNVFYGEDGYKYFQEMQVFGGMFNYEVKFWMS